MPLDPLTADFERMVRTQLAQLARQVNLNVPVTAAGEQLRTQVAAQIRAVESTLRAKVPVDPEQATEFRRKLAAQVAVAERTVRANIRVDVDRGVFSRLFSFLGQGSQTFGKLAGSATEMGAAVTKAGSAGAGAIGGLVSTLGGGVAQMAAMVAVGVLLLPLLAAVAGALLAVGGAVTAGIAGLPVLLTALVAPIAAIALGFDGIKRAAEPLRDEVDALRTAVSDTFERTMAPVFERLQGVFPVLQAGMTAVAASTSQFASGLVDVITSEAGLQNIKAALAGVGVFLNAALPGAQALLASLLNVAATQPLYAILGETIGGLSERLAGFLNHITATGLLTESLIQLRDVMFSLSGAMGELAENALEFFTTSAPGFTAFLDSITAMFERIDFAALGESFGGMLERAGAALEAVPPETWQQLADAIGTLADQFLRIAEDGGLAGFISDLADIADTVATVLGGLDTLGRGIDGLDQAIKNNGDTIHNWVALIQDVLATVEAVIGERLAAAAGWVRDKFFQMVGIVQSAGELIQAAARNAFERARNAIVDKAAEIVLFVHSLPGRIRAGLGNLAGLLVGAGIDLVRGFINGIRSMIGALASTAASMAKTALNAAKSALGIGSPSREFAAIGAYVGDGFIIGIRSRAAAMEAAVRGVLARATDVTPRLPALNLGPTAGRGTAGGSPGPGWRQAEDGSWVRPGFYPEDRPGGGAGGQTVSIDQLAEVLNRARLVAKGSDLLLVVDEAGVRAGRR